MPETSHLRFVGHAASPAAEAAPPPSLLINDDVQYLLRRFASLSVRAQELDDPEMAGWLDRAGLLAVAARLRAQDGIDLAVAGLSCVQRPDRQVFVRPLVTAPCLAGWGSKGSVTAATIGLKLVAQVKAPRRPAWLSGTPPNGALLSPPGPAVAGSSRLADPPDMVRSYQS
ncbi:hypothetical protein [Methylobacterium nodulans]|uniref:Uncharacterized protein n=1 Tax=Methylobacterium nodulans (strain LMG 21967 / CNCM I-2342 / ORS 2060) TaxID=460265 RepID=B8IVP0_METNO|nr:hypothetical protein [Methylobacterium nodulans]ACL62480.1 hypothetical protein Mnod_8343 [Methylobacterium nodulans ORS 2060]